MKLTHLIAMSVLVVSARSLMAGPAEDQVLALFEAKCSKCHKDDNEPLLSKDTSLSALRSNDKYITPGDAANSPLYKSLFPDAKKRMPKSTKSKPLPPLSADEVAIICLWIEGAPATKPIAQTPSSPTSPGIAPPSPAGKAGTPPAGQRIFISPQIVDNAILADLKHRTTQIGPKSQVRYLSLANLYNERDSKGGILRTEEDMEAYRTGVNKMLNSVSWKPALALTTPIDPAKVILRVDLDAYGISPDIWHRIVQAYPYLVDRGSAEANEAKKMLGDWAVMRADFFVFVAAQAPYYHNLLNIPGGTRQRKADVELETKLGVQYQRDVKKAETTRAGFQKSGVSQGNRLIERIERKNGEYYWKSYDFNTTRQNEQGGDLFRAPLGPIDAGLTQNQAHIFSQDGGELVFSLPNGLQGYMLIDANGIRLDEAPINVVTDSKRKDSRILNGISCIQCHREGMFSSGVKDEMPAAAKGLNLNEAERATLDRLHNQQRLERYFSADSERYMKAVAFCGPASADEPIGMLYYHFANTITPNQIAAELDVDPSADVLTVLGRSQQPEIVNLMAKVNSATPLPRIDFEKAFPVLTAMLETGKVPPREALPLTEFGGDLDVNRVNRGESTAGVTVKGGGQKRTVLRPDIGVNGNSPSMGGIPLPSAPVSGGPRVIRRIGLDGIPTGSVPTGSLPPSDAVAAQSSTLPPASVAPGRPGIKRIGGDGVVVSSSPPAPPAPIAVPPQEGAPGAPPMTVPGAPTGAPPAGGAAAPCPVPPPPPASTYPPQGTTRPPSKPKRIGLDGKPAN